MGRDSRLVEPTKTITAMDLTDALTQYHIDRNMGMPGPRQERMAADVWFRLKDRAREQGETADPGDHFAYPEEGK